MTDFKAWLKYNNLNPPECGPNYIILKQLWYNNQTPALVNQNQAHEIWKNMQEFKNASWPSGMAEELVRLGKKKKG